MGASTVRIRTWFTSLAAALGLMLSVSTAQATPLVAGSGWQFDEISISNAASANSPWTFTLTTSGVFSIVDSFIAGDTYDVFDVGGLLVTTTFAAASRQLRLRRVRQHAAGRRAGGALCPA
jgi:hypothetical protein